MSRLINVLTGAEKNMPSSITTFIGFRLNSEDSSDSVVFEHNFNETGLATSQVRLGDQAPRLKKLILCSTVLSMEFQLLIKAKMRTNKDFLLSNSKVLYLSYS